MKRVDMGDWIFISFTFGFTTLMIILVVRLL
jgi:hypothetical protein